MFKWFRTKATPPPSPPTTASQAPRAESWSARMWYRFLTYTEGDSVLSLHVDVMAQGSDIVLVPSAHSWSQSAPPFAQNRRDAVIERLKSVKWNRELLWEDSDSATCSAHDPSLDSVPGSIESTPGGKFLEGLDLFGPDRPMSFEEARAIWSKSEAEFAAKASGRVTLFVSSARPKSMFTLVSLPALQRNPNVTLDFK